MKHTHHHALAVIAAALLGAAACGPSKSSPATNRSSMGVPSQRSQPPPTATKSTKQAIFAGGCFWCMQPAFDHTPGVVKTRVGYTGGAEKRPRYKDVAMGRTGHREAIEVWYDPNKVTFQKLIDVFWRNIDPTDDGGQFADRGNQYRPAVYYHTAEEKRIAAASKQKLAQSGRFGSKPIVVPILPAKAFWVAEKYHQQYYLKNPAHYLRYKWGSGRGPFLKRVWGTKKASVK